MKDLLDLKDVTIHHGGEQDVATCAWAHGKARIQNVLYQGEDETGRVLYQGDEWRMRGGLGQ